jgi:lipooligosaccharide transport system ATP-binding protein
MATSEPAVSARNLTKRYGAGTGDPDRSTGTEPVVAVDGIDLDVPRGICFGFLGPNGAGKTSAMRMIHASSPVTSGTLEVLGHDVREEPREVKSRLGVVPQEENLDSYVNVRDNLLIYGRFFGLSHREAARRADEALAFVQLEGKADVDVDELSGGMKRRLHIARSLVNEPELLVLDEPTTGLDPQARNLVWERIRDLRDRGKTVLLTTHYMEEAEQLCDELVIMDRGRVIARGAPRGLVEEHVGREVLEVAGDGLRDRVAEAVDGAARAVEEAGDRVLVFGEDADELLETVRSAGVDAPEVYLRRASLEDVFLKLTGRRLRE